MSTWLTQTIIYGYRTTLDEMKKHVDIHSDEWDYCLAENNEDGYGWILADSDNVVVYGKLALRGEDYGNDNLFAAESLILEVPKLKDELAVRNAVYEKFPEASPDDIKYYIVAEYS